MPEYKIKITDLAEQDLENAGDYIANVLQNPSAAAGMMRDIRRSILKLRYLPERHELDEDPLLAELGVRKIYFKEYKIFYTIDSDTNTVYVIRILHMLVDSKMRLYRTFGIVR